VTWEDDEIPGGWSIKKLGDVTEVVGGGTPDTSNPANFSDAEGHPWITPADLTHYRAKYISRGRRFLTDTGLKRSSAKYLPAGSVLFSSRAPIGHVAIAANPVTTNQGFRSFVPNGELDSSFLYYALKYLTPLARSWASGTTFPELSGSKAARLPIAYPDRNGQHAIATLLDTVTEHARIAHDHLTSSHFLVERFRKSVLAAACSGELSAGWRKRHPNATAEDVTALLEGSDSRLNRKHPVVPIADDDLPEIPISWRWMSVDSLATAVVDGVHRTPRYADLGIPFITVRNLTAGPEISFAQTKFITDEDHQQFTVRTKPERGDLLISKDGTIGVVRQVRTDREFSIFVSVALVKPILHDMSDYLEIALASPQVQRQMIGVGSGLVHLVIRDLKGDGVPVPPLDEQRQIVALVNGLMSQAHAIEQRIDMAEQQLSRSSQVVLSATLGTGLSRPMNMA
jgi:type I restriction enzyme S subunit